MSILFNKLIITGKVQGVFYRQSAKDKAALLKIKGWIKNESDGSVTAFVGGETKALSEFINWCKIGPSGAVVKNVIVNDASPEYYETFTIIRGK